MNNLDESVDQTSDLEKWEFDRSCRERDLELRQKDFQLREREVNLKEREYDESWWKRSVRIAIATATLVGFGNIAVALWNASQQRALEVLRSENSRILETIRTGDRAKATEAVSFLIEAGLIKDAELKKSLTEYIKNHGGTLPALPVSPDWGYADPDSYRLSITSSNPNNSFVETGCTKNGKNCATGQPTPND